LSIGVMGEVLEHFLGWVGGSCCSIKLRMFLIVRDTLD
jgi:hypothetical protein